MPRTRHRDSDIVGDAIRAALAERARIRADFDLHLESQMTEADRACRSAGMLNARGRAAGIDPRTLFYGPAVRVAAYASPELAGWFATNGRMTYAEFEAAVRDDPWS